MSNAVQLPIPAKLAPLFTAVNKRYRCSHGGRGSAKTRTFALMTAVKAYQSMMNGESGVVLCAREFMNSLEESSMQEVKQAILSVPWLASNFDIGEKYIRTIDKSVNYVFCGLRHNLDSIKSKARILLCWVDEAESVSEIAWQKLSPTVREEGSEIWVTWNPERDGSATDKRFRKEAGDDCITVEMNYTDNPWFPDVLEGERQNDQRRLDPATYAWVWEGAYLENSDKQVLAGKYRIAEFSENLWKEADRLFFGADFGFAKDPNTLVRSFILHNRLYIEYEAYGQQTELDHMPELYDTIPGSRDWPIKADSARPETISYLKRQGFNISAAEKWQGSVEDGIAHLRGFDEIIIHPRCKNVAREARMWSYKTDRITGEVLPKLADGYEHCIAKGQLITTMRGDIPIEHVLANDFVMTSIGWKQVKKAWLTSYSRETVIVSSATRKVICTPDHEVFTANRGFVRADALRYNDDYIVTVRAAKWLSISSLMGIDTEDTRKPRQGQKGFIFNAERLMGLDVSIAMYGSIIMEKYRKASTCITKMATRSTMLSKISIYFRKSTIANTIKVTHGTKQESQISKSTLTESGLLQRNGTLLKRVEGSTLRLVLRRIKTSTPMRSFVRIVGTDLCLKKSARKINSAPTIASQRQEENLELMMKLAHASAVRKNLSSINIPGTKLALERVQCVSDGPISDVYDISVVGKHEFFAGGVLVHNCWDGIRYSLDGHIKRKGQVAGMMIPKRLQGR